MSPPSLGTARRLIVKIGSALLVDGATGALRSDWLGALADDVAALRARGAQVVIVTSGAVALGRERLGLAVASLGRPLKLEEKQAAAATGQIRLAQAYGEALARHAIAVAQVLVTQDDTEARRRATLERVLPAWAQRCGADCVREWNATVGRVVNLEAPMPR